MQHRTSTTKKPPPRTRPAERPLDRRFRLSKHHILWWKKESPPLSNKTLVRDPLGLVLQRTDKCDHWRILQHGIDPAHTVYLIDK